MIGFTTLPGLAAAIAGVATAAAGLLAALVALLVALFSRLPEGERRAMRVGRFVAGPLACAAVGVLFVGVEEAVGPGARDALDAVAVGCPLLGIGAAIVVGVALRRRA